MFHVILNGERYIAVLNGERVEFDYFDPAGLAFLKSLAAFGVVINDVTKERHAFIKQKYFMEPPALLGVVVNEIAKEQHSFVSKD